MELLAPTAVDGWLENLPELSATVIVLSCLPLHCLFPFMLPCGMAYLKHYPYCLLVGAYQQYCVVLYC